jgi:5-(carboxyamino)imidazole ribonucleotide synthase
LGRYLVLAAARRGLKTFVVDPSAQAPALKLADQARAVSFTDRSVLEEMARTCDVVTFESESVPVQALEILAQLGCTVLPGTRSLGIAQDRILEKTFLAQLGIPVAPWCAIEQASDFPKAIGLLERGAILKTAREGYDGKGQARVDSLQTLESAWHSFGQVPCVLEVCIDFVQEASVLAARDTGGKVALHQPIENRHHRHVLDVSMVPAQIGPAASKAMEEIAHRIVCDLEHVGVLAVEFFLLPDGEVLVNEIAPRPHNSGHITLENPVSQFEQHLRCILGFPVHPEFSTKGSAVMVNLLGDHWKGTDEPDWGCLSSEPQAFLHLYGKELRAGRKMGHITLVGSNAEDLLRRTLELRKQIFLDND